MYTIDRINQIKFLANKTSNGFTLEVIDSDIPSIIADIFSFRSWDYVKKNFSCARGSFGFGDNGSGMTFPKEAEEFGET